MLTKGKLETYISVADYPFEQPKFRVRIEMRTKYWIKKKNPMFTAFFQSATATFNGRPFQQRRVNFICFF